MTHSATIDIPGKRMAFIGIGGGSDCIQAAVMALLSDKESCVISIRTQKPMSQDGKGNHDPQRTVSGHGGEIIPGVYLMTAETTGSGRFLEHIPASSIPTYLVIDRHDGLLAQQIEAALVHFGAVDTVVAVDTGGDCLYRTRTTNVSIATPDQDIDSLRAIALLKEKTLISCVIANGIDSPPYADDILKGAEARQYFFNTDEKRRILDLYAAFRMDGSDPARYGKTPFAWQAALKGVRGNTILPLPDKVVNDPVNPWNPHIVITDDMEGFHLMDVRRHLKAIEA